MFHPMREDTAMAEKQNLERHYRRTEVEQITGLSRSTIYDLMSKDAFPRPVRVTARAVRWPESKITEWLAQREVA